MQMRWEPISQLASICSQVHAYLLQVLTHHLPRALVSTELSRRKSLPLSNAACNRPHQQVWYIDSNRLR